MLKMRIFPSALRVEQAGGLLRGDQPIRGGQAGRGGERQCLKVDLFSLGGGWGGKDDAVEREAAKGGDHDEKAVHPRRSKLEAGGPC